MNDLIKFIITLPGDLFKLLVICLPGTSGVLLRRWYYGKRLGKCGKDLWVGTNVQMTGLSLIEVGDDVMIRENAVVLTSAPPSLHAEHRDVIELSPSSSRPKGLVSIGSHSRIAYGAVILGYGGVKIGEKCGIGPGAIILSESFHHTGSDRNRIYKYCQGAAPEEQCVVQGMVELKDGAAIASQVIILPGAVIGNNSWVAPGSVVRVRGRIEDDVIAKGDPALSVFKRPYAGGQPDGTHG